MKSNEMHVVIDMNAHRQAIGMTKQQLADKVHKDVSVVGKQITETKRTNMLLFNAYEFAEALGGGVKFLTDEQIAELEKIEDLKNEAHNAEMLQSELAKLQSENAKLRADNDKLSAANERLLAAVSKKDDAIERKDAMLHKLLREKEAATKQMHKAGIDLSFLDEL